MKNICLLLMGLMAAGYSFAQKQLSQTEIDKMVKDAQKQADAMMKDPQMKKMMKDYNQTYSTGFEDADEQDLLLKLPPKKTTILAALSKKPFSKTELAAYIGK